MCETIFIAKSTPTGSVEMKSENMQLWLKTSVSVRRMWETIFIAKSTKSIFHAVGMLSLNSEYHPMYILLSSKLNSFLTCFFLFFQTESPSSKF